jgi:hypothetical protein
MVGEDSLVVVVNPVRHHFVVWGERYIKNKSGVIEFVPKMLFRVPHNLLYTTCGESNLWYH